MEKVIKTRTRRVGLLLGLFALLVSLVHSGTAAEKAAQAKAKGPQFPPGWTFVQIKAGTFTMGSPEKEAFRDDDEAQHEVTFSKDFWISAYEVTQAQYEKLMGENPSRFKGADRPVERVGWGDCRNFCWKLTQSEQQAGRLPAEYEYAMPTEAQWEYCCRAGTKGPYAGALDEMGWFEKNSEKQTHPVGKKKPNAWGLYDMHGNVREWCQDRYSEDLGSKPVTDPLAAKGQGAVVRGGSWNDYAEQCRSAYRFWYQNAHNKSFSVGFRIVLQVKYR